MDHFILFYKVFGILMLFFVVYLVYARMSKPKKWPWYRTREVNRTKDNRGVMRSVSVSGESSGGEVTMSVFTGIFIILIISLFMVMAYFSIKLTMKRYEIAGDAIKQGNTGAAAAVLAPEIGEGIGGLIGGFKGNNNFGY
jgi:hypothetical protein